MRALLLLLASLGMIGSVRGAELAPLPAIVTMSDQGRTVMLKPGQALEVVLDANHSTGYSWSLEKVDAAVVTLLGEPVYNVSSTKPGKTGVGGTESWHLRAVAPGQQALQFVYRRPFEPKAPPARTFSLTVRIKP